jgi:hypothetical protein
MSLDPITAALDLGGKLIDHFFPDAAQAAQAKLELIKLQQSGDLAIMTAQTDINKTEASSGSTFTSGWRPFVGWVCAAAFAIQFVIGPLAEWTGILIGHPAKLPQMDMSTMMPLLLGMLGLGGLRSYDKQAGTVK